jgi:hypothetical protein
LVALSPRGSLVERKPLRPLRSLITLAPRIVLAFLVPLVGWMTLARCREPLVPLISLVGRELLRRLGILVSRIRGKIPCSLGLLLVLVPLVALLPLGILRLLPPFGDGRGLIGAHAVAPKIPAILTISPQYVPTTIISHP